MDPATLASIIGSAAFIAALLQLVKTMYPELPTRFLPIVSMALTDACGLGAAAILGNLTWIVAGSVVVASFMASGFYASAKAIINPSADTPAPPPQPSFTITGSSGGNAAGPGPSGITSAGPTP